MFLMKSYIYHNHCKCNIFVTFVNCSNGRLKMGLDIKSENCVFRRSKQNLLK